MASFPVSTPRTRTLLVSPLLLLASCFPLFLQHHFANEECLYCGQKKVERLAKQEKLNWKNNYGLQVVEFETRRQRFEAAQKRFAQEKAAKFKFVKNYLYIVLDEFFS